MLLAGNIFEAPGSEPEAAQEDWPEKWEVTLGLRDESELPCPGCDRLSVGPLCPDCGASIKPINERN